MRTFFFFLLATLQALTSLTGALNSDNYGTVLANFGLSPGAGAEFLARGDNVAAFLAAIQAEADANLRASQQGERKE
jgi:hypothetical protein